MSACTEHVQNELLNEHSRDAIQCSYAGLQAGMTSVKTDYGPNGMRNNFDKATAHPQPYYPVANKWVVSTR